MVLRRVAAETVVVVALGFGGLAAVVVVLRRRPQRRLLIEQGLLDGLVAVVVLWLATADTVRNVGHMVDDCDPVMELRNGFAEE
ncbi:hypothetical protein H9Y04_24455 [Streptomyces sp. TRM66268-LWL]|uniref:Uncharacterized protein n=1 Tax=Streptomyces polyasparticus TaxID=2767826 RepID=A0ABR7SJM8_9ACTN|nr:hypothetical protein [Streptomyces polyasparticus]MBC9715701.1 hypothetical protein [Streptomyces polyasparticus]